MIHKVQRWQIHVFKGLSHAKTLHNGFQTRLTTPDHDRTHFIIHRDEFCQRPFRCVGTLATFYQMKTDYAFFFLGLILTGQRERFPNQLDFIRIFVSERARWKHLGRGGSFEKKYWSWLEESHKQKNLLFYSLSSMLVTVWGFLLVHKATLDTCQHGVVCSDAPCNWILTKASPE